MKRLSIGLVLLALVGCQDTGTPTTPPVAEAYSIRITGPDKPLHASQSALLTAEVRNAAGEVVTSPSPIWSTDHPEIATINTGGLLTTVAAGRVIVKAAVGDSSATLTVDVLSSEPVAIAVTASTDTVRIGGQILLHAAVLAVGDWPVSNVPVEWSSSAPDVATMDDQGRLAAVAVGTVTVSARTGSVVGTHTVTVLPSTPGSLELSPGTIPFGLALGEVQPFSVTIRSTTGLPMPGATVTWTFTDPTVLALSPDGSVQAVGVGEGVAVARSGSAADSIPITVIAGFDSVRVANSVISLVRETSAGLVIEAWNDRGTLLLRTRAGSLPPAVPPRATEPSVAIDPDHFGLLYDCPAGICWTSTASSNSGISDWALTTRESAATYSPDGSLITLRDSTNRLGRIVTATGLFTLVSAPFDIGRPRRSPDGSTALVECNPGDPTGLLKDLCLFHPNGILTDFLPDAQAVTWSPVGGLAFLHDTTTPLLQRLLVVRPSFSDPSLDPGEETTYPGFEGVTSLAWSPDATRLAMIRDGQLWILSMPGALNAVPFAQVSGTRVLSVDWR